MMNAASTKASQPSLSSTMSLSNKSWDISSSKNGNGHIKNQPDHQADGQDEVDSAFPLPDDKFMESLIQLNNSTNNKYQSETMKELLSDETLSSLQPLSISNYVDDLNDEANISVSSGTHSSGNSDEDILIFQAKWTTPICHEPSAPPSCPACATTSVIPIFNALCDTCMELLSDHEACSISHLFAIIRQWSPEIQQRIDLFVKQILARGAHVDDRDNLNDMTLLHYACKSGALGIGDVSVSLKTVHMLAANNANFTLRSKWTDMTPLHQAVYFNVAPIVDYILTISNRCLLNDRCTDFDSGSPLHIAASNLCLESLRILLSHGANPFIRNNLMRTPLDCIPDSRDVKDMSSITSKQVLCDVINEMRQLLISAMSTGEETVESGNGFQGPVTGKVVLQALGLAIGDKVCINGNRVGTLLYCGATQFASGIWAGIELNSPEGKHNGTVENVTYFRCPDKHGIFAPINRVTKTGARYRMFKSSSGLSTPHRNVNYPGVNVSNATPKIDTGLSSLREGCRDATVGDRVMLVDRRKGVIKFKGETQFAPGSWFGIELEKPLGKNDGSIDGVRYFQCPPNFGLFAPACKIAYILKPRYMKEDSDTESDYGFSFTDSSFNGSNQFLSMYHRSPSCLTPRMARRCRSRSISSSSGPSSLPNSPLKFSSLSNSPLKMSSHQVNGDSYMKIGNHVLVHGEIGVIKYVGPVIFADGLWLGIELRSATGKNDGSIQGKRYFTCKAKHGIFVRPKNVTIHGINGAKFLSPAT